MEIYKLQQLYVTIVCFFAGVVCAFMFDVLRGAHRVFKPDSFKSAIYDIIFWICCTAVVYSAIYFSNNGDLRWFELIGIMCGVFCYMLFLSKKIFGFAIFTVKLIYNTFKLAAKIVCIPNKILHIITHRVNKHIKNITPRILYMYYSKPKKIRLSHSKKQKNEM